MSQKQVIFCDKCACDIKQGDLLARIEMVIVVGCLSGGEHRQSWDVHFCANCLPKMSELNKELGFIYQDAQDEYRKAEGRWDVNISSKNQHGLHALQSIAYASGALMDLVSRDCPERCEQLRVAVPEL